MNFLSLNFAQKTEMKKNQTRSKIENGFQNFFFCSRFVNELEKK